MWLDWKYTPYIKVWVLCFFSALKKSWVLDITRLDLAEHDLSLLPDGLEKMSLKRTWLKQV